MLYWSEDSSATDTTIFSMPIAGAAAPEPFFTIHLSFNSFTMAGGCLYYSVKKALERSCGGSAAKVYEGPEYLDLTPYGSSDGSYLYFGSDYEGIMRLSLADMPSVDLLTQGTSFLDVILDRDTVYYVDGDIPWGDDICTDCWGIYSVPTTGGASTLLVAPPTEWPRYLTVDSEAIYWVNSTDELLMRLAK